MKKVRARRWTRSGTRCTRITQHEKLVARTLVNKGFEVFLPLYTEVRQAGDRTKRLELPLFSCYVFLRGDLDRRLPGVEARRSRNGGYGWDYAGYRRKKFRRSGM